MQRGQHADERITREGGADAGGKCKAIKTKKIKYRLSSYLELRCFVRGCGWSRGSIQGAVYPTREEAAGSDASLAAINDVQNLARGPDQGQAGRVAYRNELCPGRRRNDVNWIHWLYRYLIESGVKSQVSGVQGFRGENTRRDT